MALSLISRGVMPARKEHRVNMIGHREPTWSFLAQIPHKDEARAAQRRGTVTF
jgi:hypothetical protein